MVSLASSWRPSGADTDTSAISNSSPAGSTEDSTRSVINSPCRSARISPDTSGTPHSKAFSSSPSHVVVPSQEKHKTAAAVVASTAGSSLPPSRHFALLFAATVLCFCLCLCCGCPSVLGDRLVALSTAFSPRIVALRKIFHFYCLRPTGGADAARALTSPILGVSALYLPFVFLLQRYMRSRRAFRLKWACVAWNFLLSFLSGMGFLVMLVSQPSLVLRPVLPELEFTPPVRAVICLFTLSKAVEYGDTVLLVLRKKPLIFLHLYHHLTVTLYCWHAQLVRVSVGHYFAFLNLVIHSWMYLYYGLAALFPSHPLLRTWRPLITVSQILQMCVGLSLASYALSQGLLPDEQFNAALAVGMYISYAVLFVQFFFNAYVRRSRKSRSSARATPLQLLVLVHLLAAAGLYLLLTHSRRSTLLLEVLSFSAATAAVLPFVLRTHRRKCCSSSSTGFRVSQRCCCASPLSADNPPPQACCSSSRSSRDADSLNSSSSRSCSPVTFPFALHHRDSTRSTAPVAGNQTALLPGSSRDLKEKPFQCSSSCCRSVQKDRTDSSVAALEDCASLQREVDITPLPGRETLRDVGSKCSIVKPQQTFAGDLQQQTTADNTFMIKPDSPGVRQASFIRKGIDVCHSDWCAAAVKTSTAAAQAITALPRFSGDAETKQQQGMQQGSSAVAAASSSGPADMREQAQKKSGNSSRSTSSSRSPASCHQCRGTAAAAVLQQKPRSSSQQEEQQTGGRSDSGKDISHIGSNMSVSFCRRRSSSSNGKPWLRSSDDTNTDVRHMASPAAAADKEQKRNFVAAAHAALQSGGQTLLTISNFLLACALKRLMDVQEAAGAAARAAGDGRSSRTDAEKEEVVASAAVRSCVVDGSRDAAAVVAGEEKKKSEQRAPTEKNSRNTDATAAAAANEKEICRGEQQQHVDEKETEIQHICQLLSQQTCCSSSSSAELMLKAQQFVKQQSQQQQQQTGETAGDKPAKQQQQKDVSSDFFCEENSSTVCSSPDNLICSSDLYSSAAAGKSVVAGAAADTDSSGIQTATSSRAAEEMAFPPPPLQSSSPAYYSLSFFERDTPETKRSEAGHADSQLRARREEENELLKRDTDNVPQPSPVSMEDVSRVPAAAAREIRGETAFGALLQEQRQKEQQQQQEDEIQQQQEEVKTQQQQVSVEPLLGHGSSSSKFSQSSSGVVFQCTNQRDIRKTTAIRVRELLLAATCAGLPAFYGWLMHGNALLGLCVHGALRWLLELYTSRTFYSSRRRIFAAAGDRRLKQQQL